ncbi:6700_t:CDS:2, partial [Paraglomus occultum]
MATSTSPHISFFISEERPTPVVFSQKFNYTSKRLALSEWYNALQACLAVHKNDPKLVELERKYKNGHYTKAIDDYFKLLMPACLFEKEKASVDKVLTKKTGNAIRKRIGDLLQEEKCSKKSCVRESNQKTNQENDDFCPSSSNPNSEYFNTREILNKKERHNVCYSWKSIVNQIDFRTTSKDDWVYEDHNISEEFRNFQKSTIDYIKKNPILCYKKDIQKILSLSNIMLIEHIKPSFLSFSQTVWEQICRRKPSPGLPSVVINLAIEYSSLSNSFTTSKDIQNIWCNNFSEVTKLTDRDKDIFCQSQIIFRNLEIFRDSTFELVWANSESSVSKNRRLNSSENKENNKGKKPDFKIITKTKKEILFGEVKKKDSSSLLVNKDLIKLSNFQSGALDELIKIYGNKIGLTSFGIWVSGPRIRIYEMDLKYDGLYRMFLMANVLAPTERAQFLNLIPVLEALYKVKDRISEVLGVIASDTPASSPRQTYIRIPTPPPKS